MTVITWTLWSFLAASSSTAGTELQPVPLQLTAEEKTDPPAEASPAEETPAPAESPPPAETPTPPAADAPAPAQAPTTPPTDAAPVESPVPVSPATHPQPNLAAATALALADKLLDADERGPARIAYEAVVADFPRTAEATLADRMLRAMELPAELRPQHGQAVPAPVPKDKGDEIYAIERYSLRTGERLRINIWERIDFVTTAFGYGMSTGAAWALAIQSTRSWGRRGGAAEIITPMLVSSLGYGAASLLYLFNTEPDRGDLPLVLSIASYLPTSAMLLAAIATPQDRPLDATDYISWTSAVAGMIAIPTAYYLGRHTNFDPGDMQLVRDSGFWLGGISAAIAASIITATSRWGSIGDARPIAGAGIGGLWVGIGLGVLAAAYTDVSLERVRVATWAGYGGTGIGGLIGGMILADSNSGDLTGMFVSMTIGAVTGLLVGFAASESLDELPDSVDLFDDESLGPIEEISFMTPTTLPSRDSRGAPGFAIGVNVVQGRW